MYWGFTTITTVGYGDIVPHTNPEKLYSIFVMYCGVALMYGPPPPLLSPPPLHFLRVTAYGT
jgi:hypothetical protein